MRWLGVASAVVLLSVVASTAGATASTSVRVVRCPTTFGSRGEARATPSTVAVLHDPASTRGLVAYTNTDIFLIAPVGMHCAGIVGADGTSALAVGPPALTRELDEPSRSYSGIGLTLSYDPDCAGCEAEDLCPFFPQSARTLGFPCTTGILRDEQTHRLTPRLTLFEDPPGVRGDGWPSGGPDAANGLDGFTAPNKTTQTTVYRATCTLPASERWICTTTLNDVISRYG
jgi:hypothetical protein